MGASFDSHFQRNVSVRAEHGGRQGDEGAARVTILGQADEDRAAFCFYSILP